MEGKREELSQGSANEGSHMVSGSLCGPLGPLTTEDTVDTVVKLSKKGHGALSVTLLTSTTALAVRSINLILLIIFFNNYKNNVFQIKRRDCLLQLFSIICDVHSKCVAWGRHCIYTINLSLSGIQAVMKPG